jgi:hypothetical protein
VAVVARLAIGATVVIAMGLSVHHGLEITATERSPSSVAAGIANYVQEECVFHSIRADLPEGATIHITDSQPFQAQELAELSTLWAVPQATAASAEWTVTLVPGPACDGLSLKVHRK